MHKDQVFKLRLSAEDRQMLQTLADGCERSVAAMIRVLVRAEWQRTMEAKKR